MSDDAHNRGEVLFLALTRPALCFGVPFEGLAVNIFVVFAAGLELQAPTIWRSPFMIWAMAIPIHMAMRRLTDWQPHWARTLILWCRTTGRARTLTSLPTKAPKSGRECGSSV